MLWDEKRLTNYLIICCGCVSEYQNIMWAAALCFWTANLRYSQFIWAHGHNRQKVSWVLWIYFTCRSRREVCMEGLEQEENTIWKVFGQTFYSVFESKGRNMRIYCVPCPYLTSPSVPQWSELRRGEPATESVERIHPVGAPLCCPRPTNRPADYCPWYETVSADQTSLFAAVTFSSSSFFNFHSCLSVLTPPSVSSLSSPGSGSGSPLPPSYSHFFLLSFILLHPPCPPSGSIRTSTSSLTNEAGGGGGGPRAQLLRTRSVSHSPILPFPMESVLHCSTASPALISAFILDWYLLKWMCQVSRQTEIDLSTNEEGGTSFGLNWRQSSVWNANCVDH